MPHNKENEESQQPWLLRLTRHVIGRLINHPVRLILQFFYTTFVGIACLWIILFVVSRAVPQNLIYAIDSPLVYKIFGALTPLKPEETELSNVVAPWLSRCAAQDQGPQTPSTLIVVSPGQNSARDIESLPFGNVGLRQGFSEVTFQGYRIASQIESSKRELAQLRWESNLFTTTLIMLGFLTTVFAAANSSDLWKDKPRATIWIKSAAIVLPALATAMTAVQTVYASPDALSRKAQLVYSLVNLQSEIAATLTELDCPTDAKMPADLKRAAAEWNRRFGATLANTEFSQGTSEGRREQSPKNDADGGGKTDTPISGIEGGPAPRK
ncbi:hypothetical protein C3Y89_26465 [Rhizobium sp. UPM1132]|uniref:hypothetical protein n=1 Tax=Rhizobium ruizarguesonis TaxID=2081791 RepID=UPI00144660AE|nr:hypothetical protein [Rhizobium ruizarguesonis]NKQ73835.1 hypothetical protein [Rhizobium ruizarguesonis]NKQ85184.1 hypothetical protein [Rhizobium ruizarguesonis]